MKQLIFFKKQGHDFSKELRSVLTTSSTKMRLRINSYNVYGYGINSMFTMADAVSERGVKSFGQVMYKVNFNDFSRFKVSMADSFDMLEYLGFNQILGTMIQTLEIADMEIGDLMDYIISEFYLILNGILLLKKFGISSAADTNVMLMFEYCISNLCMNVATLNDYYNKIENRRETSVITREYADRCYDILLTYNSLYEKVLPTFEFQKTANGYEISGVDSLPFSPDSRDVTLMTAVCQRMKQLCICGRVDDGGKNDETTLIKLISRYSNDYFKSLYNYIGRDPILPYIEIVVSDDDPEFKEKKDVEIVPEIRLVESTTKMYLYSDCRIQRFNNNSCMIVLGNLHSSIQGYNYDEMRRIIDSSDLNNAYIFIVDDVKQYKNLKMIGEAYQMITQNLELSEEDKNDKAKRSLVQTLSTDINTKVITQLFDHGLFRLVESQALNPDGSPKMKCKINSHMGIVISAFDTVFTPEEFRKIKSPISRTGSKEVGNRSDKIEALYEFDGTDENDRWLKKDDELYDSIVNKLFEPDVVIDYNNPDPHYFIDLTGKVDADVEELGVWGDELKRNGYGSEYNEKMDHLQTTLDELYKIVNANAEGQ